MGEKSKIFVGIGGWNFAPWRGVFYPKGLVQAKELAYASEHLTSIEINSTFYGSQKPETFRKWARETPSGFGVMAHPPEEKPDQPAHLMPRSARHDCYSNRYNCNRVCRY
jgi:hypothetical protein